MLEKHEVCCAHTTATVPPKATPADHTKFLVVQHH